MASVALIPSESVLVVIDMQPSFLKVIHEAERVEKRSLFLAKAAAVLDIPILATEQNPTRMGGTVESFSDLVKKPLPKMTFSCAKDDSFISALEASNRRQVVIVGIETHICVCLTALDLLREGYEVVVCPDALSSRSLDQHKLGMERMRDAGVVPSHTETVLYEWVKTAQHPRFKSILPIVKEFAG